MTYDQNTASKTLERLKSTLETELQSMERVGIVLKRDHSRYKDEADDMINTARRKQKDFYGNMFSLALGAEFQGGKSTTVNAIADGREICPRGNGGGGIRTSACAVRVTCALNENEGISIIWKDTPYLAEEIGHWTGLGDTEQGKEKFTLDNISKNPAIWNSIFDNVKKQLRGEQIPEEISKQEELSETLDRIKQVLMLMSFYNHPDVARWRSRDTFTREEAMSFLAFQERDTSFWGEIFIAIKTGKVNNVSDLVKLVRSKFKPENAMHLFIDIVNFPILSEYLQAMGIAVIDTPGMNISDNDTRVALHCMSDAAAIFYLFSGTHQLSNDDQDALIRIKEANLNDKVFFGINFRRPLAACAKIEESILSTLKMLGYNAEHQQRLLHYNAFLAQRAKQGMLILSGKMNEDGKNKLMAEAKESGCEVSNVREAWIETTDTVMRVVKAEGWRNFYDMGLTRESVELVYKASMWEETMEAILQYVLKNKGRILLSDYIATPAKKVLDKMEARLLADEQAAQVKADELVEIYEDAQEKYPRFKQECTRKIKEGIRPDWDELIAEDIYKAVYEKCDLKASEYAADGIKSSQTFWRKLGHLGIEAWNRIRNFFGYDEIESSLMQECKAIIAKSVSKATEPLFIAWRNSFEAGTFYRNYIFTSVDNIKRDVKELWQKYVQSDEKKLGEVYEKIEGSLPKGKFSEDINNVVLKRESLEEILRGSADIQFGGTLLDVLKSVGKGYLVATTFAYVYLFILPVDFVIPFAAEIIAAIWLIFAGIFQYFASDERNERNLAEMKKKLQHEFEAAFYDTKTKREIISKLANGDPANNSLGTRVYRDFYIKAFEEAIANGQEILAMRLDEAKADAALGEAERQKTAEEAKKIREETIAPMKKRLTELDNEVQKICPATGI